MRIIETVEILQEFGDYFKQMGIIWLVLYPILWSLLIDGFYDIAWRMEGLLDNVLSFGGLLESEAVTTLYNYLAPISFTIMGVAILYFGFQLITGKNPQKTNFLLNTLLAVGIITMLPWLTVKLGEFSESIINVSLESGVGEGAEITSLSTQIVQNNTRDVVFLAENGFQEAENGINNEISDGNIRDINWVEIVHPDPDDDNNARDFGDDLNGNNINDNEVFSKALVEDDQTVDIEPFDLPIIGEIPFLNEFYYRWTGNFFNMYAQLGILVAVMLFTSFKVVRLFFEILFMKIIAPFVSAIDLSTGQRMKQLLKDLIVNFSVVGLVFLVFQVYMLAMNYVNTLDINALVTSIIMFALGLAVIDGPDQAKKLLGIDIGVKDGYRQVMGALAVGTVASKATSGLRKHIGGQAQDAKEAIKDKFGKGSGESDNNKSRADALKANNDGSASYSINDDLTKEMDDKGYIRSAQDTSDKQSSETCSQTILPNEGGQITTGNDGRNIERDVQENLIKDNSDLSTEEREVMEKLIQDPNSAASMTADERQILENLQGSDALSDDERQAIANIQSTDDTAAHKDIIGNMVAAEDSNLSAQEKEVLEKLIEDPTALNQEERQVLENLMQSDNINAEQRQSIDGMMNGGLTEDSQNRQVLEQTIQDDNSGLTNDERQVLEKMIQDPSQLTAEEREVVENLKQNDSLNPQAVSAIQNLQEQSAQEMPDLQQSRNIVESVMANDNVVNQEERQVLEKLMQDPTSLTPAERNVAENVMANQELQPTERKAFENVMSESQTSTPEARATMQTLTHEGNQNHLPEATQAVKQIIENNSLPYQEGEVLLKAVQQPGDTLNAQERQVIEKVTSNQDIAPQHREVLEKVVSNTSELQPQERQVIDKVISSPNEVTQAERQVIENVVTNDNNLTQRERTAIENVVQNHVSQGDSSTHRQSTETVTRNVVDNDSMPINDNKTETVTRNVNTRTTGAEKLEEIKRKHEEINRNRNNY